MSFSIGHMLVTPLPDGRVSFTPCRQCGDPCRGHSMAGRIEAQEVYSGAWCRTCGEACPRAQCDACRADGEAVALERSGCGHLLAEIEGREGGTRWCAGCEREARAREEERAAVVAWLRAQEGSASAVADAPATGGELKRRAMTIAVVLARAADEIERLGSSEQTETVTIARRHLATLADLANRAVANPPYHAEEVEALDAAARALGVDVSDPERGDRQP